MATFSAVLVGRGTIALLVWHLAEEEEDGAAISFLSEMCTDFSRKLNAEIK